MSDNENPPLQTCIDLLRHGETTAGKCFIGSTDVRLSEQGWNQMQTAFLADAYDLIISSPLLRCHDFAQYYAKQLNIPLQVNNAFREIDFGEWEGKTSDEIWASERESLSAFWQNPVSNSPPAGEALLTFKKRIMDAFNELLQANSQANILLVCHAGVIRIILSTLLGVDINNMQKLSVDHGAISRVHMWQQVAQVKFVNHR